MVCIEDPQFTGDYYDPEKRAISNGLTVEFKDGGKLDEVVVEYPLGHRFRRSEGIPLLEEKFKINLARRFQAKQQKAILDLCLDMEKLGATAVNEFVDLFVIVENNFGFKMKAEEMADVKSLQDFYSYIINRINPN